MKPGKYSSILTRGLCLTLRNSVKFMKSSEKYIFKLSNTDDDFLKARKLFIEYSNSLDFDLHFQNFENELKELDLQYNKPHGGLILIVDCNSKEEIGCFNNPIKV